MTDVRRQCHWCKREVFRSGRLTTVQRNIDGRVVERDYCLECWTYRDLDYHTTWDAQRASWREKRP